MKASDIANEKDAFDDTNLGKRPRLALDIEQMISTKSREQASSRRRPSASRSACRGWQGARLALLSHLIRRAGSFESGKIGC